ncbi:MAG: MmcQ/YjbR family DNA-binding protein [Planctomycetes bacterium]|nr:MmcQ/YjbR family DNA-binding protein [Planctomycetota bacterium]
MSTPRRVGGPHATERRARLIELALALPDVEASGEQHVNFKVRGKSFAWYVHDHHGDGRVALHCKASPGANSALAEVHPERFHVPAYVGKQGWLGLWLDLASIDWNEVAEVLRAAHALAAPRRRPKRSRESGR